MVAPGINAISWSLVSGRGRPLPECGALPWAMGLAIAAALAFADSPGFPCCCPAGARAVPTAEDAGASGTADAADATAPDGHGSDAADCTPGAVLDALAELALDGGRLPVAGSTDAAGTEAAFAFGFVAGATAWR